MTNERETKTKKTSFKRRFFVLVYSSGRVTRITNRQDTNHKDTNPLGTIPLGTNPPESRNPGIQVVCIMRLEKVVVMQLTTLDIKLEQQQVQTAAPKKTRRLVPGGIIQQLQVQTCLVFPLPPMSYHNNM